MVKTFVTTIGFTKTNAEGFFERLIIAGVKKVVDVRLNNTSQLSGFAKAADLSYFLSKIGGIQYVHQPLLAPTDTMLKAFKKEKGDWIKRYAECAVNRTEQMPGASWQDELTAHIINEYLRRTSIEEITERKNSLALEAVTTKLRRFKLPPVESD